MSLHGLSAVKYTYFAQHTSYPAMVICTMSCVMFGQHGGLPCNKCVGQNKETNICICPLVFQTRFQ